jgi:arylsulfatase A-like enzyme
MKLVIVVIPVILAIIWAVGVYLEIFTIMFAISAPLYFKKMINRYRFPKIKNHEINWKPSTNRFREGTGDRPPNIILIIADDLGANDLTGGAGVATPNIDSIRENGIMFGQAYSGQATCSPSRSALFTGRIATRYGLEFTPGPPAMARILTMSLKNEVFKPLLHKDLIGKLPPMRNMTLPLNETLISQVLQQGGYDTYYIGKWDGGDQVPYTPIDRGYNESLSFHRGASQYHDDNHPDILNVYGTPFDDFLRLVLPFAIMHNNGPKMDPGRYMTDYLSLEASRLIRSRVPARGDSGTGTSTDSSHSLVQGKGADARDNGVNPGGSKEQHSLSPAAAAAAAAADPFFITLSYNAPHNPYQALRSDYDEPDVQQLPEHRQRVYAAMIKALDRGVGTVLQALRETDQYENTLVIFTSDNGGAHYAEIPHLNAPYRGWKATLFEGGLKVPLFMQWPKGIPASNSPARVNADGSCRVTSSSTSSSSSSSNNEHSSPDSSAGGAAATVPEVGSPFEVKMSKSANAPCGVLSIPNTVGHVDLFPTLASLVLPVNNFNDDVSSSFARFLDGFNLLSLITKQKKVILPSREEQTGEQTNNASIASSGDMLADLQNQQEHNSVLTEEQLHTSQLLADRTLYWRSGHYKAVRKGDWKLQIALRPDKVWFFHMKSDPTERVNLAPKVNVTNEDSLKLLQSNLKNSIAAQCSSGLDTPTCRSSGTNNGASFALSDSVDGSLGADGDVGTASVSSSLAAHLVRMYEVLLAKHAQQMAPRWEAAGETPITIDKTQGAQQVVGDEVVYWCN